MNDKEAFDAYMDEHKSIYFGMPDWEKDTDRTIWLDACEYKQKESTDLIMKLQTRIESLIAENDKLFKEAKRELAYKDKKIAFLEAECERIYHPIREFWNMEKDEEMKKLRAENAELLKSRKKVWDENERLKEG